ncbi:DUF2799 domain-containing protein [Alkalimonas sp.]|uniref:DUF2799 domain-containing protein n=1 Tax=Alkalimonas sp. TaxID=1872453 RepID=UPI00263A7DAC|nr:DUF2799 domain-containing protein [Alkalimonas sp.]MCC5826160.1 DUF2799 domain-containing protein [Alkalimonas sp.]
MSEKTMRLVAVFFTGLLLSGCATLSKDECLQADWQTLGYADGVQGRSPARIDTYRQDCAKHQIVPDLALYQRGHRQGLQLFCRTSNGYEFGRKGQSYQGVCQGEAEVDFLLGFDAGRRIFLLEQQAQQTERSLAQNERDHQQLAQTITEKEALMFGDGHTPEGRQQLYREISQHRQQQAELLRTRTQLEYQLAGLQHQIVELEQAFSFY